MKINFNQLVLTDNVLPYPLHTKLNPIIKHLREVCESGFTAFVQLDRLEAESKPKLNFNELSTVN